MRLVATGHQTELLRAAGLYRSIDSVSSNRVRPAGG